MISLVGIEPGHRTWNKLLPVLDACCQCGQLKRQRQQWCSSCRQRRIRKPDLRKRTVPYGKKRGTCADCAKPVWLGTGSTEQPVCRNCRSLRPGSARGLTGTACALPGCGNPISYGNGKFCSRQCFYDSMRTGKTEWRKRRVRIRNAVHDGVSDQQIFERDVWMCQLGSRCQFPGEPLSRKLPKGQRPNSKLTPRYRVIDHIVPLSLGGSDVSTNKRAAHWLCNQLRGNRMTAEEAALAVQMPELAPLGVWPKISAPKKLKAPKAAHPCACGGCPGQAPAGRAFCGQACATTVNRRRARDRYWTKQGLEPPDAWWMTNNLTEHEGHC